MKIEPKHQIALAQMGEAIEGKLKRVMTDHEKLHGRSASPSKFSKDNSSCIHHTSNGFGKRLHLTHI